MTSTLKNILTVDHLSWSASNKQILKDISFSVKQGSFVGLIGPNGAGKSSLLRCLYRVNQPSAGSIELFGKNIWHHSIKDNARKVAVILQEHSDQMGLRVHDVIAQGLTPHKKLFELDRAADKQKIVDSIELLDLQDLAHEPYAHLSGGEKQRVMTARAMVQSPQLLLMDEPTNHLDVHYQIEILKKIQSMGVTVLTSFHDLNIAAAYCDHILMLDKGQLVAEGKPEDVITEESISSIFKACVVVDQHPIHQHPRITYAYHDAILGDDHA